MSTNIHASCVAIGNQAILLMGASGMGKSDLCLRMIMQKNAALIADDRVDLSIVNNTLIASVPANIAGLLEVRGLGLEHFPYQNNVPVTLAVELVKNIEDVERMPEEAFYEVLGCQIRKIKLYAFEVSAVDKIFLAINH